MGILINITGGPDLRLNEVNAASEAIADAAHEDANIIFGSVVDETIGDEVRITVIATGFDEVRRGSRAGPRGERAASRPEPVAASWDQLDLPPAIRSQSRPDTEPGGAPPLPKSSEKDGRVALDIPTFFRRNAD